MDGLRLGTRWRISRLLPDRLLYLPAADGAHLPPWVHIDNIGVALPYLLIYHSTAPPLVPALLEVIGDITQFK
jgi:hypothetical protein